MSDKELAYGSWRVVGQKCPLAKADTKPSIGLALEYDRRVRELLDDDPDKGVVSEDIAREAWLNLSVLQNSPVDCRDRRIAENVANQFGWL